MLHSGNSLGRNKLFLVSRAKGKREIRVRINEIQNTLFSEKVRGEFLYFVNACVSMQSVYFDIQN